MFSVICDGRQAAINAPNHREAARQSGLAVPGARLAVSSSTVSVSYRVCADGRLLELARYEARS